MVRVRLEVHYLLDGLQYNQYLAWEQAVMLANHSGPDGKQTEALIEDYVSQFPPIVYVDREVWHSLDRHSYDTHLLGFVIDPCIVSDDQLEDLADVETIKSTLADILRDGREWELKLEPLI